MNQGDETQAATILNSPLFKYLDNDVSVNNYCSVSVMHHLVIVVK